MKNLDDHLSTWGDNAQAKVRTYLKSPWAIVPMCYNRVNSRYIWLWAGHDIRQRIYPKIHKFNFTTWIVFVLQYATAQLLPCWSARNDEKKWWLAKRRFTYCRSHHLESALQQKHHIIPGYSIAYSLRQAVITSFLWNSNVQGIQNPSLLYPSTFIFHPFLVSPSSPPCGPKTVAADAEFKKKKKITRTRMLSSAGCRGCTCADPVEGAVMSCTTVCMTTLRMCHIFNDGWPRLRIIPTV